MITDEQIRQIAKNYIRHVGSHYINEMAMPDDGGIEEFARELIALAQQEPAQAVPQHVIDAANRIPQNVIETPQAVSVGYFAGWYGGCMVLRLLDPALVLPENIALYTSPVPLDSDTRKMVLELCDTIITGSIFGIITKAKQIRERLEAGE